VRDGRSFTLSDAASNCTVCCQRSATLTSLMSSHFPTAVVARTVVFLVTILTLFFVALAAFASGTPSP
jgi:hypothetical protein